MTDEKKQEEVKQKYLEVQMMKQQLKQLEKQLQALAQQEVDLDATRTNLDEIATVKPGTEILVPVASGIFLRATAKETNEFIVNIGSGAALPRSVPEVKRILTEQISEVGKLQQELSEQAQLIANEAQKEEIELRKMIE